MDLSGMAVSRVRILRAIELTEVLLLPIHSDIGSPFPCALIEKYALEAGNVMAAPSRVPPILPNGAQPQIDTSIVEAASIDVINNRSVPV